jgi:hypothetical protein
MKTKLTRRIEAADRLRSSIQELESQLENTKAAQKRHKEKKKRGLPPPKSAVEALLLSGVDGDFSSSIRMLERHIEQAEKQLEHLDSLNYKERRRVTL